jgi:hypothetical protein
LRISRPRAETGGAARPAASPELTGDTNPGTLPALAIEALREEESMSKVQRAAPLLLLVFALACTSTLGPRGRAPVRFQEAPAPSAHEPEPYRRLPPEQAYELLASAALELRSHKEAGGGTTGAEKHTVYFPSADVEMVTKWKDVPGRLDGVNNSPRKELAAYAIQRIFLTPEDYVVPAAVARCERIETYRERHQLASPSVWITSVTVPEVLYDEERFRADYQYAYFMSNFNLLTYLIKHRDGRDGNMLVSEDDSHRRVFSVDNGIAFGARVFNYFVPNWYKLRVAAVRKESVDRLRAIRREDLDFLAVVAQLEVDEEGMLRSVPPGAPFDPADGAVARGGSVQFGLTTSEIDDVYARIEALIEAVDEGRVPVF